MPRRAVVTLALLLVSLSLAHSLSLSDSKADDEDEVSLQRSQLVKRDGRRMTRNRYRMGYMYGKRSDDLQNAGLLIETLTGKLQTSVDEVSSALQSDPAFARRVARHLDRNGDGYVSVKELL